MGTNHINKSMNALVGDSIEDGDRMLLGFVLDGNVSQAALDSFIKGWDIETAPMRSILLVADLMRKNPELVFPDSVAPRLNGVLSYCRFKNLKGEAVFSKVANALAECGVPFVPIGDVAMKAFRPDFMRRIDTIDLLVPDAGCELAGKVVSQYDGDTSIIIHKSLNDNIFSRAAASGSHSPDSSLPCPEDMVSFLLLNLYYNLLSGKGAKNCLTVFPDIKYLAGLKESFDTGIVWEDAVAGRFAFQVMLASRVAGEVLPGIFPERWPETTALSGNKLKCREVDFLFRRDVLSDSGKGWKFLKSALKKGSDMGLVPSALKRVICSFK